MNQKTQNNLLLLAGLALVIGVGYVVLNKSSLPWAPAPTPNPTPEPTPKPKYTCRDGSTADVESICASRGGLAPAPCQGITNMTEFYRCMERNA